MKLLVVVVAVVFFLFLYWLVVHLLIPTIKDMLKDNR